MRPHRKFRDRTRPACRVWEGRITACRGAGAAVVPSVLLALLAALVPGLTAGRALAFGNAQAKLVIHLTAPSAKAQCGTFETCPPFHPVTSGGLYPPHSYFAYIIVTGGSFLDGLGGIEFGIDYDGEPESGVEVYDWTFCGALQYPSGGWPAAGGGNLVSWNWAENRRLRGRAVVGYLYLGAVSPDRLRITASPAQTNVLISDSRAVLDQFPPELGVAVGAADFGGGSGVDPTRPVPAYDALTWQGIARLYEDVRKKPGDPAAGSGETR